VTRRFAHRFAIASPVASPAERSLAELRLPPKSFFAKQLKRGKTAVYGMPRHATAISINCYHPGE